MGVEEMARAQALPRLLSFGGRPLFVLRRTFEIGFDLALELDRHRLAIPVAATAGGDPDPAFRDRIFDDVGLFLAVELDAHAAREQRLVEMRASRVEREAIGRAVGSVFGHSACTSLAAGRASTQAHSWWCKVSLTAP